MLYASKVFLKQGLKKQASETDSLLEHWPTLSQPTDDKQLDLDDKLITENRKFKEKDICL